MVSTIPNDLISFIRIYLDENPDGASINGLARHFNVNRQALGPYLKAYEEMGVLKKVVIGPAFVYRLNKIQGMAGPYPDWKEL